MLDILHTPQSAYLHETSIQVYVGLIKAVLAALLSYTIINCPILMGDPRRAHTSKHNRVTLREGRVIVVLCDVIVECGSLSRWFGIDMIGQAVAPVTSGSEVRVERTVIRLL